jgi:hypothetical protein
LVETTHNSLQTGPESHTTTHDPAESTADPREIKADSLETLHDPQLAALEGMANQEITKPFRGLTVV